MIGRSLSEACASIASHAMGAPSPTDSASDSSAARLSPTPHLFREAGPPTAERPAVVGAIHLNRYNDNSGLVAQKIVVKPGKTTRQCVDPGDVGPTAGHTWSSPA